jgi:two-component system response regulator PilR (NtrC family)
MAPTHRLLVVDDEPDLRTLYELTLLKIGYQVDAASDMTEARQCLAHTRYDLLITDMRLPDGLGLDLVRELQSAQRAEKSIVVTAYGSAESAVDALKAGAFDYLTKPVDLAQFRAAVANALRQEPPVTGSHRETQVPGARSHQGEAALRCLVGDSPGMRTVRDRVQRVARSMAPVLVLGESGTGKELAAKALHACSHRADGPFVAVNCGAIPESLIEAEFFGVRKGAYTGATHDRPGYFQAASGGTLFLDEIGDLPLPMQAKLLRAIQERQVRALGSTQEETTDVRIVSATHHDLAKAVREGRFRQDLFYRLNVIELRLPPLRERREDLRALAQGLLERLAQRNGEPQAPSLAADALQCLHRYAFPGNVRELENILERAMALYPGDVLSAEAILLPQDQPDSAAETGSDFAHTRPSELAGTDAFVREGPSRQQLEEWLHRNRWNQSRTARQLGWTLAKLRYWMQRHGLE